MQFKLHSDIAEDKADFFEMNPGARAVKVFNNLRSRQMMFVCLVADRDWDNPVRSLPEPVRREQAARMAGWGMEGNRPDRNARNLIAGKVKNVEIAIEEYRKMQWDEEREMLEAINSQIQESLLSIRANKEELAKVVKTTVNKKTNETQTTEYVDAKSLTLLRKEARDAAAKLPELKAAKDKLTQKIHPTPTGLENVVSYTAQDVTQAGDNGEPEEKDEDTTTLDDFNEKRFSSK